VKLPYSKVDRLKEEEFQKRVMATVLDLYTSSVDPS
jgi:hypothetical protein